MILRKLEQGEHGRTRKLWEEVFTEDTKSFLDYYYYIKTRDNQIYVIEDEGEICSMLQLNPYTLGVEGREFPSAYIIAVATRESCRGRGYMGALLRTSLKDMYSQKMPFTFLMPAAEAIYTPYDFRYIYEQPAGRLEPAGANEGYQWSVDSGVKRDADPEKGQDSPVCGEGMTKDENTACTSVVFSDAGIWDAEEIADFFRTYFYAGQQVCTVRDTAYYQTMILEQQSQRGGIRLMRDHGVLKGTYAYADEDGLEIREPLYLDGYEEAFLQSVKELVRVPGQLVKVCACPPKRAEKTCPLIMARIVCLPALLSAMTVPEDMEMECSFAVIDPIINKNSRIWKISSSCGERQIHIRETEDSEGVLPIADLTEILFGRISPEAARKREGVILSEHLAEELQKITKLTRSCLNEVV